MINVFKVADLLIEKSLKDHKDEIDMIACYGSHSRGDARKDSDLDIFFTPSEGKKPQVDKTFLLKGVLFDFWGLSWKTLEGFATGTIRGWAFAPALVSQAKILYAWSEREHQRLQKLKDKTKELQQPTARQSMIKRGIAQFSSIMPHLVKLEKAVSLKDQTSIRFSAWKILEGIWECLALANQIFFEKGLTKSLKDVSRFKYKPPDMERHIAVIITSLNEEEIWESCNILINETRLILRNMQLSVKRKLRIQECFSQFYPEMKDLITKILANCKKGSYIETCNDALLLQKEMMLALYSVSQKIGDCRFNSYRELSVLYDEMEFPDLMINNDLIELEQKVLLFDKKLRGFLTEISVDMCEYDSLQELETSL